MPLKTLVKVSTLTNLSDARYCAGMGVQLLGFQAISSRPGYITPARFQEIRGWLAGPEIVAEAYGLESREQLREIIEFYRPDYLELGISELPLAAHMSIPLIIALKPTESLPDSQVPVAYAIVDANDTRDTDVSVLVRVSSPQEVSMVLALPGVHGVVLKGGEELSPGINSYDTLAPILEMLEGDD